MTANTDELAGLPEDVREAVAAIDGGNGVYVNGDDGIGGEKWRIVRAELLRLRREVAKGVFCANMQTVRKLQDAEAELAAIKETPTGTTLDWALRRAEKAEAELAALKRRIAEAEHQTCATSMPITDGLVTVSWDHFVPIELLGQRVALLPVGGKG